MGDLILFVLALLIFSMLWIEWGSRRFDTVIHIVFDLSLIVSGIGLLPSALGWVFLVLGVADLLRMYHKAGLKIAWHELWQQLPRLPSISIQRPAIDHKREASPKLAKIGLVTLGLMLSSPIAAIPSMLVLMAVMLLLDPTESSLFDVRRWLGFTYVGIVGSVDLIARQLLWLIPLGGFAFLGATRLVDDPFSWKRFWVVWLMVGSFLSCLFFAADTFGWIDGPIFN